MPPPSRSPPSNPVRLFDKADGEDDFKHDNEDDEEEEEEESDGVEKNENDFKLKSKSCQGLLTNSEYDSRR